MVKVIVRLIMFLRSLVKPRKRHVLYVFMISVLGMFVYCTLYDLHSTWASFIAFIDVKHNHFLKRAFANTQLNLPWEDLTKIKPQEDIKKELRGKSKKLSKISQKNKNGTSTTNTRNSVSNVTTSEKLFGKPKSNDTVTPNTQSFAQIIRRNSDEKRNISETKELNSTKDRFKSSSAVKSGKILNRHKHGVKEPWNHLNKNLMNVSDHSCKPLFPRVVLYNRIFKTASTTMSLFLEKCSRKLNYVLRKEETEEWSNERTSHPILSHIRARAKLSHRRRKRLLAVAHFYFRINTRLKMKHTYINLLREPIERFISHYYYARSPTRWPKKLRWLKLRGHWNVTLEECLEKQYEGCTWNTMTRFFCGPDKFCKTGNKKALALAKFNMFHYYASVGVVEYLNEFVQVLHKRLPEFIVQSPKTLGRRFVTRGVKKTSLSSSLMARIAQVNRADTELYDYAKTLFLNQAKQCGIKVKR